MSNKEQFENVFREYAAKHVTGATGIVMKIASYFYEVRQPEIDALIHDNASLYKTLNDKVNDNRRLEGEIAALKEEFDLFKKTKFSPSLSAIQEREIKRLNEENYSLKAEIDRLQKIESRYKWMKKNLDKCVEEHLDKLGQLNIPEFYIEQVETAEKEGRDGFDPEVYLVKSNK